MQGIKIGIYTAIYSIFLCLPSFFFLNYISNGISLISPLEYKVTFIICIIIAIFISFKRIKQQQRENIIKIAIFFGVFFFLINFVGTVILANIGLSSFTDTLFWVVFYGAIPFMIIAFFILKYYKRIYKRDLFLNETVSIEK